MHKNQLYYGDNLEVLQKYIKDESVDLVYLDPPFNSNRNYSVIFNKHHVAEDENKAQIHAFEDTWHWTHTTERQFSEFVASAPGQVGDALTAFYTLLGENDAMAYLTNMAPRLLELHRVLKPTGSLYLHCDPTMSHYLKVLLDSIFDPRNFRNEVIWKRTSAHSSANKYGPIHDVILYYGKTKQPTWTSPRTEYTEEYLDKYYKFDDGDGRLYWRADLCAAGTRKGSSGKPWRGFDPTSKGMHWKFGIEKLDELDKEGRIYWAKGGSGWPQYKRYRDELPGLAIGDIWDDIDKINPRAAERLGYPTQKPLNLLDRIIQASSNEGDVVLDPFCGCGTTVDAAERLNRKWIGIDITYIAVDLITKRLRHTYGNDITTTFDTNGIPRDVEGARALFARSPFDFERWAVSLIGAEPNQKQVGDRGIDGVARFPLGNKKFDKVLVSVKGGKSLNPSMVRDLGGTVDAQKAAMGVLITLEPATKGVQHAIDHGGVYTHPANNQTFPKLQHVTVADLLGGKMPKMPLTILPYIAAEKLQVTNEEHTLF
ncbi:DNA methyltransferase [Mycobacterium avium]|uniref:DNA methyltransferase n=1 Tax=Mycobacterium avium TaxID=1764 RepID=UPI0007A07AC6|nr:DNA methyltransferase [Mycobacterium avium]